MQPLPRRPRIALAIAALAAVAIAVPVLGGAAPGTRPAQVVPGANEDPDATPAPEATGKPGKGPKEGKPGRGQQEGIAGPPGQVGKEDRPVESPVELTGVVGTRTDAEGGTEYTLTVDGAVLAIEAGPPWWWGDDHPLAPFVGQTVTVQGEQAAGSDSVDVHAVDGTVIREAGRPPWAGGPKVVGERHPGWKAWKVEREPGTHGRPPWAGPKEPKEPKEPEGDEAP